MTLIDVNANVLAQVENSEILNIHYGIPEESALDGALITTLKHGDLKMETKVIETKRKKKRTAMELVEIDKEICALYAKGFSENAIANEIGIGKGYVTKIILKGIRTGSLELVATTYDLVEARTSIKSIAELLGFSEVGAETLFAVEFNSKEISIKLYKTTGVSYV